MRTYGLKLLVYAAFMLLVYEALANSVCGLKLLVYADLRP
jgi:hypothetical protein